jgi:hypothetical protein
MPRQNGKNTILEVRELGGLYYLNEELIIHTAHEFKTAQEHFRRVRDTVENNPQLSKRLKGRPVTSHGEESIELLPTSTLIFGAGAKLIRKSVKPRLRFLARSKGSGRGFSCDCLVFDESMILSAEAVGAARMALSARSNPQTWFTSSSALKDSFQLASIHRRILRDDKTLFGAEWAVTPHNAFCHRDPVLGRRNNDFIVCDSHDDRDDPRSWAKSNPAYNIRISPEECQDELNGLAEDPKGLVEFDRERLGVGEWPAEEEAWEVVAEDVYDALAIPMDDESERGQCAFAVEVDEDGVKSAIAVAWIKDLGLETERLVMETPLDCVQEGTEWLLPKMKEMRLKYHPVAIVWPRTGPAAGLMTATLKASWERELIQAGSGDEAAAFAHFMQLIHDKKLGHFGKERGAIMRRAVATSTVRIVGDGGKAWSRRDSNGNATPISAGTNALWGLNQRRRSTEDPLANVQFGDEDNEEEGTPLWMLGLDPEDIENGEAETIEGAGGMW